MIKCPRCGFEQPRDRFCAKCGIVMEGFVPEKRPFSKRLGGSTGLIVGVLIAIALVVAYFYRHPAPEPEVESSPPAAKKLDPRAPEIKERPKAAASSETTTASAPVAATPGAFAGAPGETATRPSPVEARSNEPSQVQIEFDVATKDLMERLSQESETPLEIGRYTIAVVPQFKTKYDGVKSEQGFKQLATESRNLAMGQPSLVFRGGKEPKSNETIGFYVEVTPSRQTERGPEFKISVKRSLPEIASSGELKVNTQSFEETITVPHNAAVIFAGLLPRKQQLVEGEDELYKGNVLSPFLEPTFEKGDEEFLIIVNPHFGESN